MHRSTVYANKNTIINTRHLRLILSTIEAFKIIYGLILDRKKCTRLSKHLTILRLFTIHLFLTITNDIQI